MLVFSLIFEYRCVSKGQFIVSFCSLLVICVLFCWRPCVRVMCLQYCFLPKIVSNQNFFWKHNFFLCKTYSKMLHIICLIRFPVRFLCHKKNRILLIHLLSNTFLMNFYLLTRKSKIL